MYHCLKGKFALMPPAYGVPHIKPDEPVPMPAEPSQLDTLIEYVRFISRVLQSAERITFSHMSRSRMVPVPKGDKISVPIHVKPFVYQLAEFGLFFADESGCIRKTLSQMPPATATWVRAHCQITAEMEEASEEEADAFTQLMESQGRLPNQQEQDSDRQVQHNFG